jgi:hypothetical protein
MNPLASLIRHGLLVIGGLLLCVIPASAEDAPDSNAIEPAVEIEIVLDKSEYAMGETISFELYLINRLESTFRYIAYDRLPQVSHPQHGKVKPTSSRGSQTFMQSPQLIAPEERVRIATGTLYRFNFLQEGEYTIQGSAEVDLFPSDVIWKMFKKWTEEDEQKTQAFRKLHPLPDPVLSKPVAFTLRGDTPLPMHVVSERLRARLPEGEDYLARYAMDAGFAITGWFNNVPDELNLFVGPYEAPSKYDVDGKSLKAYEIEFLGKSPWGPVWAQYHPAMEPAWPDWRTVVAEVLELTSSDKPSTATPRDCPLVLTAKLDKTTYRLDEPIPYRLEVTNLLNEPVLVRGWGGTPQLTDETGAEQQPIARGPQHWSDKEIPAGETVCIREGVDLREDFVLIAPGRYTLKGAGRISLYPYKLKEAFEDGTIYLTCEPQIRAFEKQHPLPSTLYSAPVSMELRGGSPRPQDIVAARWRERLPEMAWLVEAPPPGKNDTRTTIGTSFRYSAGAGITFYLGEDVAPHVEHYEPTQIGDFVHTPEPKAIERLGRSPWGFVWAKYDSDVDEQWPEWQEAAREVWEIAPDEAPESTP